MKKINRCEICKSKKIKFLMNGKDRMHYLNGNFPLFRCQNCGLIFLTPQPSPKELERFYPSGEYYSYGKIRTEKEDFKVKLKLKIYKIFKDKKNKLKKFLFSALKIFIREPIFYGKRLLDVGCGSGQFLYEMKKLGYSEVYGIEPGNFDAKFAKENNLKITKKDLLESKFPSKFFDVVTMNHVLEHVHNPEKTIKEIKRILKTGGIFVLAVPNTNSQNFRLFGRYWFNLDVPRHLFHFSDKNLSQLLETIGFKIIKIIYRGEPISFKSMRYFLEDKFPSLEKNKILIKSATALSLLVDFFVGNILSGFKTGDQVEIVCKK